MGTPEPQSRDRLRATTALSRMAALVGRACAEHHALGPDHRGPDDPLIGLDDGCHADAAKAGRVILWSTLSRDDVLERLKRLPSLGGDPYEVAQLIAEASGFDGWKALRAFRIANQAHADQIEIDKLGVGMPEIPPGIGVEVPRHIVSRFDRAFDAGVGSLRYMRVDDQIHEGPLFGQPSSMTDDPDLLPVQVWIDLYLRRGDV